MIINYNYELS